MLLQPGEQVDQPSGDRRGGDKKHTPGPLRSAHNVVHKHAKENGQGKTGQSEQEAAGSYKGKRGLDFAQPAPKLANYAWRRAAGTKPRPRLRCQDDSGKCLIKGLFIHGAAAIGGIVKVVATARKSFEY